MSTSAYTRIPVIRIPVIILAALALAACPGKKNKHHDDENGNVAAPNFYVGDLVVLLAGVFITFLGAAFLLKRIEQ